jgi:HSP20 family protein
MTLVKFRKSSPETFNNFMDDFFIKHSSNLKADVAKRRSESNGYIAPVNIKKLAAGYQVEVIVPGFQKEDFKINLEQKTLTISAEVRNESKEENETYLKEEFQFKPFKRSFTLGEAVDTDKIDAKYVNGVLTLNFPHKQEVKVSAKNISVE